MTLIVSDNFQTSIAKPLDNAFGPYAASDEASAIALACAALTTDLRFTGLTLTLIINGIASGYLWRSGIADADLVPVDPGGESNDFGTDATNFQQIGTTYINILCQYTNQLFQVIPCTTANLWDGTSHAITDADVDDVIYFKRGDAYYKRVFTHLEVEWFGPLGALTGEYGTTDDAPTLQKALDSMAGERVELIQHVNCYILETIILRGGYINWRGSDESNPVAVFSNKAGNADTTPITTMVDHSPNVYDPSSINLGHVTSTCIFLAGFTYYAKISNLAFGGAKFGLVFFTAHNSPTIKNCMFDMLFGVFMYQGSQNTRLVNCGGNGGVMFIAGATCTPEDSPYAGTDNYYCDGTAIVNEGSYNSYGATKNETYDEWFRDSILLPNVRSFNNGYSSNALYGKVPDTAYDLTDPLCLPTGRLFYVPMRNLRNVYGFYLHNLDIRGYFQRGIGLINGYAVSLRITGNFAMELITLDPDISYFTVGNVAGGLLESVIGVSSNLFSATARFEQNSIYTAPTIAGMMLNNPFLDGSSLDGLLSSKEINGSYMGDNYRTGFDYITGVNSQNSGFQVGELFVQPAINGNALSDDTQYLSHLLEGYYFIFDLPVLDPATAQWTNIVDFRKNRVGYFSFYGLVKFTVMNITKGEYDEGVFQIGGLSDVTFTNSAIINNGDTSIAVTAVGSSFDTALKYQKVLIAPGVYAGIDYWDQTNNLLKLIGCISGLSSPVAIGTNLDISFMDYTTIKDFSRNWIGLSGENIYNNTLNATSATDTPTGDVLRILVSFTQNMGIYKDKPNSGAPTTGQWKQGAVVNDDNPVLGGYAKYICVQSGDFNDPNPANYPVFTALDYLTLNHNEIDLIPDNGYAASLNKSSLRNSFVQKTAVNQNGMRGNAVYMTSGYSYSGADTGIDLTNFTIAFWRLNDQVTFQNFPVLNFGDYTTANSFSINTAGYIQVFNNNAPLISYPIPGAVVNDWCHIIVELNGGIVNVYLNGEFVATAALGAVITSTGTLQSNELNSDGPLTFVGKLDQLLIYNTQLTDIQKKALYNFGNGNFDVPVTDLVRRFDFESDGSDTNPTLGTQYDLTFSPTYPVTNGLGIAPLYADDKVDINLISAQDSQTAGMAGDVYLGDPDSQVFLQSKQLVLVDNSGDNTVVQVPAPAITTTPLPTTAGTTYTASDVQALLDRVKALEDAFISMGFLLS